MLNLNGVATCSLQVGLFSDTSAVPSKRLLAAFLNFCWVFQVFSKTRRSLPITAASLSDRSATAQRPLSDHRQDS